MERKVEFVIIKYKYYILISERKGNRRISWLTPFANEEFDLKRCKIYSEAHHNWAYKDSFIKPIDELKSELQTRFHKSFVEHLQRKVKLAEDYTFIP